MGLMDFFTEEKFKESDKLAPKNASWLSGLGRHVGLYKLLMTKEITIKAKKVSAFCVEMEYVDGSTKIAKPGDKYSWSVNFKNPELALRDARVFLAAVLRSPYESITREHLAKAIDVVRDDKGEPTFEEKRFEENGETRIVKVYTPLNPFAMEFDRVTKKGKPMFEPSNRHVHLVICQYPAPRSKDFMKPRFQNARDFMEEGSNEWPTMETILEQLPVTVRQEVEQ